MTDALYSSMALPDACHLGKRVFKKLFSENASLTAADKRAFADDIENVTWHYTLKPSTVPISAYEDDEREYHEVAVIQVNLKTDKRTKRIAEVIHRSIPYPVVLVLSLPPSFAVSLAHERFSRAEKDAIVADGLLTTQWIDLSKAAPIQREFLDSLALKGLPQTHFYAFYSALMDRLIALEIARLSGFYRIESAIDRRAHRRAQLADCHALESQIADQRVKAKREKQVNRQVDLNLDIKRLEARLAELAAAL